MSQALELLDEALHLARQEKTALEDGEYAQAIDMAQRRGEITDMAWNCLEQPDRDSYKVRLLELSSIQQQLIDIAKSARDMVKQRMNRSKLERRRMQGYHMAVGQAMQ